jgi:hypothetical protein
MLVLAILNLLPSRSRREIHHSNCAANLRGITQSMNIYATENSDSYPILPYASSPGLKPATASSGSPNADEVLRRQFAPGGPRSGSIEGTLWILVLAGHVSPRQFVCNNDRFADRNSTHTTDSAGNYFDNFQSPKQLSYSMAYPWNSDGKPGDWWTSRTDASLPLVADMAPRQGTGKPARNLTPAAAPRDNKTWNSGNHGGDGQNIGFADGHAEFARRPDIGQQDDNIYSMSASPSKGPAQFGGIPAGAAAPMLTADKAPFDIIMLPVRDEATGKM